MRPPPREEGRIINCTKLGEVNHDYRVVNQRNVKTHTRALSRRAERRREDRLRVVLQYQLPTVALPYSLVVVVVACECVCVLR